MARTAGIIQRTVECIWCGESVTAKCFLRHIRGECVSAPKETADKKICTICQQLIDKSNFSKSVQKNDGLNTACKDCSLARYKKWRSENVGRSRRGEHIHPRPNRWTLAPCPYCSEKYSFNAMTYHKPRCPKAPTTGKGRGQALDPTIVVPENTPKALERYRDTSGQKSNNLKFQYGINLEEWNAIFQRQGGVCRICKEPSRTGGSSERMRGLHVDHDHVTGKIRGLLCHFCNIGIGHFREDIDLMESAIAYLREHKPETE